MPPLPVAALVPALARSPLVQRITALPHTDWQQLVRDGAPTTLVSYNGSRRLDRDDTVTAAALREQWLRVAAGRTDTVWAEYTVLVSGHPPMRAWLQWLCGAAVGDFGCCSLSGNMAQMARAVERQYARLEPCWHEWIACMQHYLSLYELEDGDVERIRQVGIVKTLLGRRAPAVIQRQPVDPHPLPVITPAWLRTRIKDWRTAAFPTMSTEGVLGRLFGRSSKSSRQAPRVHSIDESAGRVTREELVTLAQQVRNLHRNATTPSARQIAETAMAHFKRMYSTYAQVEAHIEAQSVLDAMREMSERMRSVRLPDTFENFADIGEALAELEGEMPVQCTDDQYDDVSEIYDPEKELMWERQCADFESIFTKLSEETPRRRSPSPAPPVPPARKKATIKMASRPRGQIPTRPVDPLEKAPAVPTTDPTGSRSRELVQQWEK